MQTAVNRAHGNSIQQQSFSVNIVDDQLHTLWQRGLLEREVHTLRAGNVLLYRLLPTVRPYAERYMEQAHARQALLARFGEAYADLARFIYREMDRSAGAIRIAQRAREDLDRGVDHVEGETHGYYLLHWGWILKRLGDTARGLDLTESALEIAGDRYQQLELEALNNIGLVYDALGDQQQVLGYYEQALPLSRQVGDRAGEAATLNNMAYIYFQWGEPDRTVEMLRRALELVGKIGAVADEAGHLYNLAVVLHTALGRTEEAIELVSRSIGILKRYNLPQDANGTSLAQHEAFLAQMRGASSPSTPPAGPSTMPADQIQTIVNNTITVMTVAQDRREEWRAVMAGALQQALGINRPQDAEFFTAVLAILGGQAPELPEDHPHAEAVAAIRAGIAAGGAPAAGISADLPFDPDLISRTVAALRGTPQDRMALAQHLATLAGRTTDEDLKAFIVAIQTALFGGDLARSGEGLSGVYGPAWEAIVAGVDPES